ncbi:pyridoxal phosphate-dependent transferase [Aspergillus varians]
MAPRGSTQNLQQFQVKLSFVFVYENGTLKYSAPLHADNYLNLVTDIAPPIHLSTTFRFPKEPENLIPSENPVEEFDGKSYVYSREFAPNATRVEAVVSSLLNGYAVSYSTGLAALHAALILLNPRRVSVGEGYHGSHEVIAVISRLSSLEKLPLDCPAESLREGDVIILETPVNPLGTAFSIKEYAKKAHARGAYLIVDSTFAPPSL